MSTEANNKNTILLSNHNVAYHGW